MSDLIQAVIKQARVHGLPLARLADKAGIRPETLSRLQHRDNFDVRTLHSLALAVGCRVALVPLNQDDDEYSTYSPRENARAKVKSRKHDEEMIASGIMSSEEVQKRNGFFSLPNARVAVKSVAKG
jgi:hypothetical protein